MTLSSIVRLSLTLGQLISRFSREPHEDFTQIAYLNFGTKRGVKQLRFHILFHKKTSGLQACHPNIRWR